MAANSKRKLMASEEALAAQFQNDYTTLIIMKNQVVNIFITVLFPKLYLW